MKNLPAILIFVDFRKAFDSIHSWKLMEILMSYRVPVEIVDAINMMFSNIAGQVLSADGDTEFFEILAGVLQTDTLALYLFIIALDYTMRQAVGNESNLGFTLDRSRSRRHPAKVVLNLWHLFCRQYSSTIKHFRTSPAAVVSGWNMSRGDWTPFK